MAPSEIHALSDAELVARVAEKVMGNIVRLAYKQWWIGEEYPECHTWKPLTDWNDTMTVDHAIAMLPYPTRERFQNLVTENGDKWFADIDKRDILEAALIAVSSAPQAAS